MTAAQLYRVVVSKSLTQPVGLADGAATLSALPLVSRAGHPLARSGVATTPYAWAVRKKEHLQISWQPPPTTHQHREPQLRQHIAASASPPSSSFPSSALPHRFHIAAPTMSSVRPPVPPWHPAQHPPACPRTNASIAAGACADTPPDAQNPQEEECQEGDPILSDGMRRLRHRYVAVDDSA